MDIGERDIILINCSVSEFQRFLLRSSAQKARIKSVGARIKEIIYERNC
jgi:hypothetical protein